MIQNVVFCEMAFLLIYFIVFFCLYLFFFCKAFDFRDPVEEASDIVWYDEPLFEKLERRARHVLGISSGIWGNLIQVASVSFQPAVTLNYPFEKGFSIYFFFILLFLQCIYIYIFFVCFLNL